MAFIVDDAHCVAIQQKQQKKNITKWTIYFQMHNNMFASLNNPTESMYRMVLEWWCIQCYYVNRYSLIIVQGSLTKILNYNIE